MTILLGELLLSSSRTSEADGKSKFMQGGKAAWAISAIVNKKALSLECARLLHENMLS